MAIMDNIRACLDKRLATLPGLPDVAWPNTPYEHIPGTTYLKVTLFPNSIRPASRGPDPWKKYDGIYSILVCTPEGEGPGAGYSLADDLLEHFKATSYVTDGGTSVTIDYSEVGTSFLDSPFYCTPVDVAWYIYDR